MKTKAEDTGEKASGRKADPCDLRAKGAKFSLLVPPWRAERKWAGLAEERGEGGEGAPERAVVLGPALPSSSSLSCSHRQQYPNFPLGDPHLSHSNSMNPGIYL